MPGYRKEVLNQIPVLALLGAQGHAGEGQGAQETQGGRVSRAELSSRQERTGLVSSPEEANGHSRGVF